MEEIVTIKVDGNIGKVKVLHIDEWGAMLGELTTPIGMWKVGMKITFSAADKIKDTNEDL